MPTDAMQAAPPMGAPNPPADPTPIPKAALCPYCGHLSMNTSRCESCRGYFDPLSRQASQNSMGPWFIRDEAGPFRPGCSYDTLCSLIRRGKIGPDTVLRGPTTRQFWAFARSTPGVAHRLSGGGECHNCHAPAAPDDRACRACGADFTCADDRQHLGLAPVHLLPGHTSPEIIAASTQRTPLTPAPAFDRPAPVAGPGILSIGGAGAGGGGRGGGGGPILPPELLTPALDRVAGPASRRRRDGTMVWVGIALGAVALTALLAAALNWAPAAPANRQQSTAPSTAPITTPSEKQPPAPPAAADPAPTEPAATQTPPTQEVGSAPAVSPDRIARLLGGSGAAAGPGLDEAGAILAAPEHAASPDLAGFRGVLPVRRDQARLSAAL